MPDTVEVMNAGLPIVAPHAASSMSTTGRNAMDLSVFDVVGVRGAGGGREAVLVTERDVVPGAVVARAWP